MSELYDNLEEASAALASTAQRAANLIRTESARAKDEAIKTRREIEDIRSEMKAAKVEFEDMKNSFQHQTDDRERIRRSAGWAWSAVGAMAAIMIVAVGWTCIQLTRGHEVATNLNARISDLQNSLNQRETAIASLQTELNSTKLAETRVKAQLDNVLNSYEPFPFEVPAIASTELFAPAGPHPIWTAENLPVATEEPEITVAE